jgi:MarC family integral membrane protein
MRRAFRQDSGAVQRPRPIRVDDAWARQRLQATARHARLEHRGHCRGCRCHGWRDDRTRLGVSAEALLLTGGIILFLVALRLVLQQYAPPEAPSEGQESTTAPVAPSSLAFAPLAFPTIVTPYGIAVLVVLVSASNAMVTEILALTAVVLVLDLLAMLFADRILKTAFVASSLNIAGAVMGVLQVALGVEVIVFALRLLGVVDPGRAA